MGIIRPNSETIQAYESSIERDLENNAFIWQPEILKRLRNLFPNKPVIVIDIDGVIRAEEPGNKDIKNLPLNPEAINTLQLLRQGKYPIVYWTSGTRISINALPINLLQLANLTITRENYDISSVYERESLDYNNPDDRVYLIPQARRIALEQAIKSTPWMSEGLRANYKSYAGKFPELLFPWCGVVDDSAMFEQRFSTVRQASFGQYKLIDTPSQLFVHYFVDSYHPKSDPTNESYFGKNTLTEIKNDFPLK